MPWILLVAVVCLVAAAGCDSAPPPQISGAGDLVVVTYDNSFEDNLFDDGRSEAEALREAIHFWNVLGANLRTPDEVPDVKPRFAIKRDSFSWPGSNTSGICWPGLGYITLYPNDMKGEGSYRYNRFRNNAAHELGHALGLGHVGNTTDKADGWAVMSTDVSWGGPQPTDVDVKEFHRVWSASGQLNL